MLGEGILFLIKVYKVDQRDRVHLSNPYFPRTEIYPIIPSRSSLMNAFS